MKASVENRGLSVVLLALPLIPFIMTAKISYPEGLEILSKFSAPRYYSAQGYIEEVDQSGATVTELPFRFYWEKGEYALDIRTLEGGTVLFARGKGDTIWVYDFSSGSELIILSFQEFPWLSNLLYNPKDMLPMFNIFPKGFPPVESYSRKESTISVVTENGTTYELTPDVPEITEMTRDSRVITRSKFIQFRGVMWPLEMSINHGILTGPSGKLNLNITKYAFNRDREQATTLTMPVPYRMKSKVDLRP